MTARDAVMEKIITTAENLPARIVSLESPAYVSLRTTLHNDLINRVDLKALNNMPPQRLREQLAALVVQMLSENSAVLNLSEQRQMIEDIQNEVMGFGPIEPLLADPAVSDILVNGPKQVYIERGGKLELTGVKFTDAPHLMKIINKIVSRIGRHIDESSPMVDARLPDGSRVNAVIPPLAMDGPLLSVRRFPTDPLKIKDLLEKKSLTLGMMDLLTAMVRSRLSILISGGTGSGKTTLLNILSSAIPANQRIVTIEDTAELRLQQPHVVRLETRPPNIEGKGEVNQRALVRNSLRMRPDRIILGEVRGVEVLDMLQAMNTGHDGSMATVHANNPRDTLTRLENMCSMGGLNIPSKIIRQQISSAISAVVQIARLTDGRRRVVSLQEIVGMEGDIITMQEIFSFTQTGVADDGSVLGYYGATGVRPQFMRRVTAYGNVLPEDIFNPNKTYE